MTKTHTRPAAAVRGKYAAAFKKGVRVLKRNADGTIIWKYPPAKVRGSA